MKIEEDKFGTSPIKPIFFYSSEGEKIKLNWFCYELCIGIYHDMKNDLGKRLKKHKIGDEALIEFSIYVSKIMKDIILQKLSGRIEKVEFSYETIESYFPNLNDRTVNKMLDVISKTWDTLLGFCETCPIRCISEKDSYCTMFDESII